MSENLSIIGFSFLRNAIKYDYPFRESLQSLTAFCDDVILAVGKSDDGTEEEISKNFPHIQVEPTIWDENLRKSGLILSQQTNIALDAIRKKHSTGWALYLQGDEVISDLDFKQLQIDFEKANEEGCDAIRFRYLHFWKFFHNIAIGKRWYPQEIRAIRIDSDIVSYGDAQSFQGASKIYESDIAVFHYGHVREKEAYQKKKNEFHHWWHSDEEIKKKIQTDQNESKQASEEVLTYLGPHASFMAQRMKKLNAIEFSSDLIRDEIWIFSKEKVSYDFEKNIKARNINWVDSVLALKKIPSKNIVLFSDLSWVEKLKTCLRFQSKVPNKMRSPLAREWTKGFRDILKLSEKNIFWGE